MVTLDEKGFLPPGIHDLTLGQIGAAFGSFQETEQRPRLFKKLEELVEQIGSYDFVRSIIVDGSFVTDKTQPSDIDLIIVVDPQVLDRLQREMVNPFEYSALSSRRLRKRYPFDVFVVPEASDAYDKYVRLFSRIKGGNSNGKKGIVRLALQ